MTKATGGTVGTVARTVQMLRYIAEHPETKIKEIAEALNLAPSTCHRLLDLLAREGMVEHDKIRRCYGIGLEFFRIAAQVQTHNEIRDLALPLLRRVVDACHETCVLCMYDAGIGKLLFVEKVDSSRLLRYQLPMNEPLSVLWGASGRAVLAFLPPNEVERIYDSEGNAPASGEARPSRKALETELKAIRARGYAVSFGQKIAGAVGINAPVFDAHGRVIGSLGVTAPESRVKAGDAAKLGDLVRTAAEELSRALGYTMNAQGQRRAAI
jgi:DNA-binding IclR family transcriptional regulator